MIKIIVGNRNSGKTMHLLNLNHVDSGILSKKMIANEVTCGYNALLIKDQMEKETPFVRRIEDKNIDLDANLWMKFNERYAYNKDVYKHVELIANDFIQKSVSEQYVEKPFFVLDELSDFTVKRKLGFYKSLVMLVKYHKYYRLCVTTTKNNLNDLVSIIEEVLGKSIQSIESEVTIDYLHDVACVLVDADDKMTLGHRMKKTSDLLRRIILSRCFSKKIFVTNSKEKYNHIQSSFGSSIDCIYCEEASQSKLYKKGLLDAMGIRPSGCMFVAVNNFDYEKINFNLLVRQFKNIHQKKNPCDLDSILYFKAANKKDEITIFSNAYYRQILKLSDHQDYSKIVYNFQDRVIQVDI